MRGKAVSGAELTIPVGITPAYAGKSNSQKIVELRRGDHPRVCGEKSFGFIRDNVEMGSPPRMRGKGILDRASGAKTWITPAYAGKRRTSAATVTILRDHPRVCGEKFERDSDEIELYGSPPRMRGKVPC